MAAEPYILFCAGEDSGDCLGESLVRETLRCEILAKGSGGRRMQGAGMDALVDFETLPVSGFADVLPRYSKLRRAFATIENALESPDCLGLVAIDYPGFNMKLVKRAGELRKPALYIAPPQVWAWKKRRARELFQNPMAKLAVFFDFEEKAYAEAGCNVVRMQHPFVSEARNQEQTENIHNGTSQSPSRKVLLLPGSRRAQALRNLSLFLQVASQLNVAALAKDSLKFTLVAARESLVPVFEKFIKEKCPQSLLPKFNIQVAPQDVSERRLFYGTSSAALTSPGTATLELALSGTPMVVCYKPDLLTYLLGKLFIRTWLFALPNLILNKRIFYEFVYNWHSRSDVQKIATALEQSLSQGKWDPKELVGKLSTGVTAKTLMSEFLGQFV